MRATKLTLAVVITLAAGILAVPPAHAGNWAATVLDPLPQRIQPGQTYTVGYWVMQHAAHPYENSYGPLGKTALRIVDEDGTAHTFAGVPLGQPSHYAATLSVPHAGTWKLVAQQGRFGTYRIGTLTVPGGLEVIELPPPVSGHECQERWGLIRSPAVGGTGTDCEGGDDTHAAAAAGSQHEDGQAQGVVPADNADGSAAAPGSDLPANSLWVLAVLTVLGGMWFLVRRVQTRVHRRAPGGARE
ncbi:MAG: hypothetical protein GEU93_03025 [Propionibacteriales bacterium]|nr:hypothetical protein [Propionibacteriales bacterium]